MRIRVLSAALQTVNVRFSYAAATGRQRRLTSNATLRSAPYSSIRYVLLLSVSQRAVLTMYALRHRSILCLTTNNGGYRRKSRSDASPPRAESTVHKQVYNVQTRCDVPAFGRNHMDRPPMLSAQTLRSS